jgi:hypothetical protein
MFEHGDKVNKNINYLHNIFKWAIPIVFDITQVKNKASQNTTSVYGCVCVCVYIGHINKINLYTCLHVTCTYIPHYLFNQYINLRYNVNLITYYISFVFSLTWRHGTVNQAWVGYVPDNKKFMVWFLTRARIFFSPIWL